MQRINIGIFPNLLYGVSPENSFTVADNACGLNCGEREIILPLLSMTAEIPVLVERNI